MQELTARGKHRRRSCSRTGRSPSHAARARRSCGPRRTSSLSPGRSPRSCARSVSTNSYEKAQAGKGKRTAGIIGGGAGLGALIGGLAGGGKGAAIGALAGGGAGTAGAAYTGNKDVVIPAESVIAFHLTAPLS